MAQIELLPGDDGAPGTTIKKCYHNGDFYISMGQTSPCPKFEPIFISTNHTPSYNGSSKNNSNSTGYWTHIGIMQHVHAPGDPECIITWKYERQ